MSTILTAKCIPDGLHPVKIDRHGPAYHPRDVMRVVAADIVSGNYFERRIKYDMTPDYEKATQIAKDAEDLFFKQEQKMMTAMRGMQEAAKKASGGIRDAAENLRSGMERIEKQANFHNLERYVGLLERAASAMQTLADLEKTGKLDKIAGALK